jgi:hypothetical protein
MMRTRLIRHPGQPSTKKLVKQYGAEFICVRYAYDDPRGERYKTVELIVKELPYVPAAPKRKPETLVGVRLGISEGTLQRSSRWALPGTVLGKFGSCVTAMRWNLAW